jgi:P-type E1-E2 ATPase
LETLCKVDTIIFDKTGTITEGKPQVTDIVLSVQGYDEQSFMQIAITLEAKSEHPLAEAIVQWGQEKRLSLPKTLQNFQAVP